MSSSPSAARPGPLEKSGALWRSSTPIRLFSLATNGPNDTHDVHAPVALTPESLTRNPAKVLELLLAVVTTACLTKSQGRWESTGKRCCPSQSERVSKSLLADLYAFDEPINLAAWWTCCSSAVPRYSLPQRSRRCNARRSQKRQVRGCLGRP